VEASLLKSSLQIETNAYFYFTVEWLLLSGTSKSEAKYLIHSNS